MHNVAATSNKRSMKNNQNPATAHHTIMTARRPDNIRSSILVRGRSIRPWPTPVAGYRGHCPERIHIFAILAGFFVNRFWGRRPDGVAINEALKIVYISEFKRSTDRDEGFLEVKEAEANEQHKSIIDALKAAAPKWEFEQIDFVVGNRGLAVESDFCTKLKKLDIQEGKIDKLFADHVTQVCEAHNQLIVSFLQQVQGGTRPTTEGSRENIGHKVHV